MPENLGTKVRIMISQKIFELCCIVVVFTVLPAAVLAQQSPYDVFPAADPPYYRVRYEASTQPGELNYSVNYTIWIPAGVQTLRGVVVHQHGCGEGSCKSGLTGAFDLHWQALAKKHDCALLAPAYEQPNQADCQMWCDPRNGSSDAFQKCLADLGVKSGHPELESVPWALWGHSGGGHWAGGMVLLHPDRVAAAWLRSGVPLLQPNPERATIKSHVLSDAALRVPVMCNPGTKEGVTVKDGRFAGVWPANEAFFSEVRSKGGLIGVAVDPLTAQSAATNVTLPFRGSMRVSVRGCQKSAAIPYIQCRPIKPGWLRVPDSKLFPPRLMLMIACRRRGCRTKRSPKRGCSTSKTLF